MTGFRERDKYGLGFGRFAVTYSDIRKVLDSYYLRGDGDEMLLWEQVPEENVTIEYKDGNVTGGTIKLSANT